MPHLLVTAKIGVIQLASKESIMLRRVALTLLALIIASLAVTAAAQNWVEQVGLTSISYNGSRVAIILISTGADLNNPTINASVLRVDGVPCMVDVDSQGGVHPLLPPYDLQGIGTEEALAALQAAPAAKLLVVRVPYQLDPETELPTIPVDALEAALEWALSPYVTLPNGTQVACDLTGFTSVIVLVGLPVYNYTLSATIASLLSKLVSRYLVVVPVGDVAPGVFNALTLVEGVVGVGPLPEGGGLTGYSGGYTRWTPSTLYRDLPITPSYVMPVDAQCLHAPSAVSPTCSEIAAAEFAGFAAVTAQMYYELRGVPPAPYQLENLIRASVHDYGAPGKDSVYGWGVPDARIAYQLLAYNAGFIICAPKYNTNSFAVAEVSSSINSYAVVLLPGECVRAWALPGVSYTVTIYSAPTMPPAVVRSATTVAGYWAKLHPMPEPSDYITLVAKLVDEKGVALSAVVHLLPRTLYPIDQRWLVAYLHPLHVDAGNMVVTLSCSYLSLVYGAEAPYMLVQSPGKLSRILRVPGGLCGALNTYSYGRLVFADAPTVYLLGYGPGAEEDAQLLRLLGFRVEQGGVSGLEAGVYDVIVVHPSAAREATVAKTLTRSGVVLEGDAALEVRAAYRVMVAGPEGSVYADPVYTSTYQPVLRRGSALYTLYPYQASSGALEIPLYNITAPDGAAGVMLYAATPWTQGRIVEVYVDPWARTSYIANMWSLWRIGRSLEADLSVAGLAALQLAIASVSKPLVVSVNGSQCPRIHPETNITVDFAGWDLAATLWVESTSGFRRVATVEAPYPNYTASVVYHVGMLPAARYYVKVNDSLWRLGVACFQVTPVLYVETPMPVTAGGTLTLLGLGFRASTPLTIALDGVSIASSQSDVNGTVRVSVRVPAVTPPGRHTISVSDGLYTASAEIVVRVIRTLQVIVSAPTVVEEGSKIPVTIITRLNNTNVDADVTLRFAGRTVHPLRLSRGIYYAAIGPLPPGSYVIIVNATLNEPLVYASNVAALTVTVQKVVHPVSRADLEKATAAISTVIEENYRRIDAKLAALEDRIARLTSLAANATKYILGLNETIDARLRTLLASIADVKYTVQSESRRTLATLEDRLKDIDAKLDKLAGLVTSTEGRLGSLIRSEAGRVMASIRGYAYQLNHTLSTYISRLLSTASGLGFYIKPVLALLAATTAMAAFLVATCLRAARKR